MILDADTCACVPNSHLSEDEESCECDSLYHWNSGMTACVLDTTSHDFVWSIDTLGIHLSFINDVSIINENDIWVVGQITLTDPDSSYNNSGREEFNAAHWDGQEWELLHLISETITGPYIGAEIMAVYAVTPDDVWMYTSGGAYIRYFNGIWSSEVIYDAVGGILDIWGPSADDLYFVGTNGSITHYDGSSFSLMSTPTNIPLLNVFGSKDGEDVFASGRTDLGESIVLSLQDHEWQVLFLSEVHDTTGGNFGHIYTAGLVGDTLHVATAYNLHKYNINTGEDMILFTEDTRFYFGAFVQIVSQGSNDIMYCGEGFNTQLHFNGVTFNFNYSLENRLGPGPVKSADYKDNIIVMVGDENAGSHAIVVRGKRT